MYRKPSGTTYRANCRRASLDSPAPPTSARRTCGLTACVLCQVTGRTRGLPLLSLPCILPASSEGSRWQSSDVNPGGRVFMPYFSDKLGCSSDRDSVKTRTGLQREQRWNNQRTTAARELRNRFHKTCAKKKSPMLVRRECPNRR